MKKNKVTKFLFGDLNGYLPEDTCELFKNVFEKFIIMPTVFLILVAVAVLVLSPLALPFTKTFFPENFTIDPLGFIGSLALSIELILGVIFGISYIFESRSTRHFVSDVTYAIKTKTCVKLNWKE